MEKKFKGGSTSMVVVTDSYGSTKEYNTKEPMEKVIATSNESKWHQTETNNKSDLLKPQLIKKLGLYGEGVDVKDVLAGTFVCPNDTSDATKEFLGACKTHVNLKENNNMAGIRSRFKAYKTSWNRRR